MLDIGLSSLEFVREFYRKLENKEELTPKDMIIVRRIAMDLDFEDYPKYMQQVEIFEVFLKRIQGQRCPLTYQFFLNSPASKMERRKSVDYDHFAVIEKSIPKETLKELGVNSPMEAFRVLAKRKPEEMIRFVMCYDLLTTQAHVVPEYSGVEQN